MNFYLQLITHPVPWKIEVENPAKGTLHQVVEMAAKPMDLIHDDYFFYHRQGKTLLDGDTPLCELPILDDEGVVLIPKHKNCTMLQTERN